MKEMNAETDDYLYENTAVDDLETIVTKTIEVPHSFHRCLYGPKGAHVDGAFIANLFRIVGDFEVKFPDLDSNDDRNMIRLTGLKYQLQTAIRLIEFTLGGCMLHKMNVPPQLHGLIIGKRGRNVSKFQKKYQVNVLVPGPGETFANPEDYCMIEICGPPGNVIKACATIERMISRHDLQEMERIIRGG